jgi:hypothetical protein
MLGVMVVVLLNVGMGTMGDKTVVVVTSLTDLLTDYVVFVFVSEVDVMALELLVMLLVVVLVVVLVEVLVMVVLMMVVEVVLVVTFPLVLVRM